MEFLGIIFGAISGILSYWSYIINNWPNFHTNDIYSYGSLLINPGFVFAVSVLLLLFLFHHQLKIYRILLFTILSIIGYIAAYWCAFTHGDNNYFWFFIAGIIGSFVLSLGLLTLKTVNWRQITVLILLGGVFSLAYFIPNYFYFTSILRWTGSVLNYQALNLFVIWQTGMMVAITYFAKKNLPVRQ